MIVWGGRGEVIIGRRKFQFFEGNNSPTIEKKFFERNFFSRIKFTIFCGEEIAVFLKKKITIFF